MDIFLMILGIVSLIISVIGIITEKIWVATIGQILGAVTLVLTIAFITGELDVNGTGSF